tara:strand:- start:787 stop:1014 length:228 start_codon:yes stop_codon:yes gene_type:complete
MTEQESKDLKMEIHHIFDSGANEMRIFNMIEMFLDRRDEAINYTHCCTELKTEQECYKTGKTCMYKCKGLCKDAC